MTAIERAKSILTSLPADESIEQADFMSAIAGYLEGQLKIRGKMKDASDGFKYKTKFVDPATGKKRGLRFKLKDGKITIRLKQEKKKKKE